MLFWVLMWASYYFGFWWLTLLLAVPAAGFLVRLFMIQHDCGHGAFFRHRLANDWIGRALGVLTLTPYDFWRRTHAIHHATSGNLERRGIGDVDTLTVREYLALSRWRRLMYRFYRHPAVMFGLGPAYLFVLRHRLPFGLMRSGWQPWLSTMGTNLAIAIVAATLIWLIGVGPFLLVHGPIMLLAAAMGVWLFYVQHQFEQTVWAHDDTWNLHEVALHGSSYYVLPGILRWFTANIGVHHVHHLCSRIPYYRLPRVLREHPELERHRPAHAVAKHQMRPPGAVGREPQEADLVPRDAPHACVAASARKVFSSCLRPWARPPVARQFGQWPPRHGQ